MPEPLAVDHIRAIANVGHGLERTYVARYQRAIDVVLALVESAAEPLAPTYSNTWSGSDYGRGYVDGLHAKAHQVFAELARVLLDPDQENADAD